MRTMGRVIAATLFLFVTATASFAAEDNNIVKRAQGLGIVKCLPAIRYITTFIIDDGVDSGYKATWSSAEPDKSIYNVSIERNYPNGTLYADVTFSHTVTGACAAVISKMF